MPRSALMPLLIFGFTALGIILAGMAKGYMLLVLSLIAMTATVGVGLNVLLGLTGQVSFGHVGFYALGAYTTGILALKGVSFWIAFPLAGLIGGAIGFLLALPALRVKGPYLAMVTIAFAFIIEHGAVEWRDLTGGANGLMGIMPPALGRISFGEREMAMLAVLLAGLAFALYHRLDKSAWGLGMRAVRDAETAAQSLGLDPVKIKVVAFTLSAVLTALAGALFSPLMMFIAPSSFPFFQSILFLLAVIIGGAGSVLGPLLGAVVVVGLPEVLSDFAEYRLLFFGVVLLVVLWAAPKGLIGTLGNRFRREDPRRAMEDSDMLLPDIAAWLKPADPAPLEVKGLGISFGGLRAAHDVAFTAQPGQVTSVIGPNGAGKTTVLNMIGGFYKPGNGSIQLQHGELAGLPAWRIARAGIARTYQTTQLFPELSVIDNIRIALRRGRLGALLGRAGARGAEEDAVAEALLAFVGYREPLARLAGSLPHVDRRLVEIARALATRPRVLLLDEPAAGLMRADKDGLSLLLRRIADAGIAVILVEHDMTLVMGISDHIVVLDAGTPIAAGAPLAVRGDARVIKAYLGEAGATGRPRAAPWQGPSDPILAAVNLTAGYGAAPVLEKLNIAVKPGELVALLGANGAGKSTAMRAISGLLRPIEGQVLLNDAELRQQSAPAIARAGLALVPEGRQVFPELSVLDNLKLGAYTRRDFDAAEIEAVLNRFPRLRERLQQRAGLLSGGEQQMLALGRGMLAKPKVMLLDEPSLGLAPAIAQEVFTVLADLRDEGVTLLLVDQMATQALAVADRAYVLEQGRVVREGQAAELRGDKALEAAYLGGGQAAAE
jgi:branched-chain amino acid transport system ATP-binding protein